MKGIILAGGTGSRLFPATIATCKQLLPVYDKPLVYYPLDTLIQAGISEILLISTPTHLPFFKNLFGDGKTLGISMQYASQDKPNGIAEALLIGEKFIDNDSVVLILGDNIFYGKDLINTILQKQNNFQGALTFACKVENPNRFGVVCFDDKGDIAEIVEKPMVAPSDYAVIGIYVLDSKASYFAKQLKPSQRNELEITDLQNIYLQQKQLNVHLLPADFVWFDAGNADSLFQAACWVKTTEERIKQKIGAVEISAYQQGYISLNTLFYRGKQMENSEYGKYLIHFSKQ